MINQNEIVLLDDNDDTNYYNQDIIEETKLFDKVLIYSDPNKLLTLIKSRLDDNLALPSVFLIDINMPMMDGFEFLDEMDNLIYEQDTFPKVFILSTSNHKRDREQFDRSFLAKGYIDKPLLVENLATILNLS